MDKVIVVVPDLQVPYHHQPSIDALSKFIKATKPTVVSAGDEMDFQTISKWSKGTLLEYERSIGKDRDATVRVLEQLKVEHVIRSNHTDRLFNTVHMRAPGLLGLPELDLSNFLRFDLLGITYHKEPYELAPNWLLMHGDEGNISQTAGQTALNLAKRTGKSVVCGHTHRAGLMHHTEAYSGKPQRTLWGLEVGNMMNMKMAKYLKGGMGNWQKAFGMLVVDGKKVSPTLVPVHEDGSFYALGKKWTS